MFCCLLYQSSFRLLWQSKISWTSKVITGNEIQIFSSRPQKFKNFHLLLFQKNRSFLFLIFFLSLVWSSGLTFRSCFENFLWNRRLKITRYDVTPRSRCTIKPLFQRHCRNLISVIIFRCLAARLGWEGKPVGGGSQSLLNASVSLKMMNCLLLVKGEKKRSISGAVKMQNNIFSLENVIRTRHEMTCHWSVQWNCL